MYKKIVSSSLVAGALLAMNGCGGGGGSTVDSSNDGIQLSKDTIQELRTQALSLVDYSDSGTDGYLDTEAVNIGAALENCSIDVMSAAESVEYIMFTSMDALYEGDYIADDLVISCDTETNICTYSVVETEYTGTVTLPDADDSTTLGNFTTLHGEFHGTVPFGLESTESQTFDLNITLTKTEVGADLLLTNLSVEHNETSLGISDLSISTAYTFNEDTNDTNLTWAKLNEVTLNGTCSEYTMVGKLSLPNYVTNTSITDDNAGMVPSQLIFNGSLTNTDTDGKIEGNVEVNWINAGTISIEEDPIMSVAIDGSIAVPERPEMTLELTYNNDSLTPEVDYHEFTSAYSYDATMISLDGTLDDMGENGQITIDGNNGIVVLILIENGDIVEGDANDSTGSIVTYNGSLIGTLEYLEDLIVIRYTDGSFESLP